jgi:hypothetical protein
MVGVFPVLDSAPTFFLRLLCQLGNIASRRAHFLGNLGSRFKFHVTNTDSEPLQRIHDGTNHINLSDVKAIWLKVKLYALGILAWAVTILRKGRAKSGS